MEWREWGNDTKGVRSWCTHEVFHIVLMRRRSLLFRIYINIASFLSKSTSKLPLLFHCSSTCVPGAVKRCLVHIQLHVHRLLTCDILWLPIKEENLFLQHFWSYFVKIRSLHLGGVHKVKFLISKTLHIGTRKWSHDWYEVLWSVILLAAVHYSIIMFCMSKILYFSTICKSVVSRITNASLGFGWAIASWNNPALIGGLQTN